MNPMTALDTCDATPRAAFIAVPKNRLYDVNSGAIYVDGKNIKDYNRQELRSHFGMVLQDTWLFSGSIKDNIKYGKLDATDEQVKQAAKAAHVDHFIKTLPSGYDMVLNEEASNVSQGQKQLLTIARAILADPCFRYSPDGTWTGKSCHR